MEDRRPIVSPWMEQFEQRCSALLQTADTLLARYPRLRRRPGASLAGRVLYPCLPLLRGLEAFLPPEECRNFRMMEEALSERLVLLGRRRIPPGSGLMQLRSRCRALMLSLPKLPNAWDSPSVLVGTLRSPHQLDVCLTRGFYHVPACHIPEDRLPISYVAIYQSRALFPEDCGIRFYGRIKSCTPVRRWQIGEIPKDSDELYYRLEVDTWEQLEPPVAVREVPFPHLFTNLFLLRHSKEIPELSLDTPAHYQSYQALRRSLELGNGTALQHPKGTVRLKNGLFEIHHHGRKIATFCAEDFTRTPAAIFRELMGVLDRGTR